MKSMSWTLLVTKVTRLILYIFYLLFSISLSFKFFISFTPFYKFLMKIFNISKYVNIKEEFIYSDFNKLMHYLTSYKSIEFPLEHFKYSNNGKFHFMEVRLLFLKMDILFWVSLSIVFLIVLFNRKKLQFIFKNYFKFLLGSLITLFILSIPVVINFSWTFEKFHKLVFDNNDWLFDPRTDPIINILPEEVFFSYLISILFLFIMILIIPLIIKRLSRISFKFY